MTSYRAAIKRPKPGDEFVWLEAMNGCPEITETVADVIAVENAVCFLVEYGMSAATNSPLAKVIPAKHLRARMCACRITYLDGRWRRLESDIAPTTSTGEVVRD